jgi:hypothetical protein
MRRVGGPETGRGGWFRAGSPVLVGRGGDLAVLREVVVRRPAVVLIEGEAGVGKSRLVSELLVRNSFGHLDTSAVGTDAGNDSSEFQEVDLLRRPPSPTARIPPTPHRSNAASGHPVSGVPSACRRS